MMTNVYLAYSIRYSKSAQISMDKMSESISNHNGGSDKDVGSDLRFQNLRKKEIRGGGFLHTRTRRNVSHCAIQHTD